MIQAMNKAVKTVEDEMKKSTTASYKQVLCLWKVSCYIFERIIKLTYPKVSCKKRNFVDSTMVRERKVIVYFQKVIFHLTTMCENAAKKARKHTKVSILAA